MPSDVKDALILAGGFGTRLRAIVSDVPKPMAPVRGRPFLEYLLDYWTKQGISRFVLSVGYLAEKIQEHFGSFYGGASIEYLHEHEPLGTGGAIGLGLREKVWSARHLLVLNGDTWFNASLEQLILDARASDSPITMTLKKIHFNDRYGGVELNEKGLVTNFSVAKSDSVLINAGCYLLDASVVGDMMRSLPSQFSFEQDFLVGAAKAGHVAASVQDADFIDIGVPEDYARAGEFLTVNFTI